MTAILRPHQTRLLAEIDQAIAAGDRHIVAQAATGFGKTIVGATIAKRNLEQGRRTLFTVPALELIDQAVEKFYAEGIRDGELVELDSRRAAVATTQEERITFHAELRHIAERRSYKTGWAAQQYKTKFGSFPPWAWNDRPTCVPSASTLSWVRSRQIAYAKQRLAS